jgi:hypothetical protein
MPEDLERTVDTSISKLDLDQMLKILVVCDINLHGGEILAPKGCQGPKGHPWLADPGRQTDP